MEPTRISLAEGAGRLERGVVNLGGFLAGGAFPTLVLWILFWYELAVVALTFAPLEGGAVGAFVAEFRVRCYQYQPRTGGMEWESVLVMLGEPLPLALMVGGVWGAEVARYWRRTRRGAGWLGACGLLVVGLLVTGLGLVGKTEPMTPDLPFPAERLRSALPMPDFSLTDQAGERVSVSAFKGRVTLVTAVYSTCTTTCPRALGGIRRVLDQLTPAERGDLGIVAISLRPEVDTREARAMVANSHGFPPGQFHFVSGTRPEIDSVLDQMGISRTVDPATGEFMHSGLFLLLDRQGRIAYRLSLSPREQSWLVSALRVLLGERAG